MVLSDRLHQLRTVKSLVDTRPPQPPDQAKEIEARLEPLTYLVCSTLLQWLI